MSHAATVNIRVFVGTRSDRRAMENRIARAGLCRVETPG